MWLQDDRLRPKSAQMPGADGIMLHDSRTWISITDQDPIVRSKIATDGNAGLMEVIAEKLRADDFAFGESGAANIATHPAQTVLRLRPDGKRETIAGPHEGAVGTLARLDVERRIATRSAGRRRAALGTHTGEWSRMPGSCDRASGECGQPLLPGT